MSYYLSLEEAQAKAQNLLDDRCSKLRKFLNTITTTSTIEFKIPEIRWRAMGKQIAGRSYLQFHIIEMNTNYLSSKDCKEFVVCTLLHELAHLIAFDLFRETGHGIAWKKVARFLGDDGNRCHDYAEPTVNHIERRSF